MVSPLTHPADAARRPIDEGLAQGQPERFDARILEALRSGAPLSRAIGAAGRGAKPAQVKAWFKSWMALGWFCVYGNKPARTAS